MNNELTCQELVELVTSYLEGALSETERQRFESHLSACHACQNHLDQMRYTIRLIGRVAEYHISTTARDELLAHFRNWKLAHTPYEE